MEFFLYDYMQNGGLLIIFRLWRVIRILQGFFEHLTHMDESFEILSDLKSSLDSLHGFIKWKRLEPVYYGPFLDKLERERMM